MTKDDLVQDWDEIEALRESLREHMAEIHRLRAELAENALQRLADVHQEIEATDRESRQVEPVAWMVYTEGGTSAYVTDNPNDLVGAYRALALYTAPPQRTMLPLTDEEIHDCFQQSGKTKAETRRLITRAIERAYRIGDV